MAKKVKHTIYTTDYNEEDWRKDYEEWLEMNEYTLNFNYDGGSGDTPSKQVTS